MTNIATLMQFLYEGDILGLLQAIYVSNFVSSDLFYGFLTLLLTSPLYIRTKSLMLLIIIWILLGGLFIVAMPIVSGLGLFLVIMGFGALFFKLFLDLRGREG